jgi:peptide methionine sulfoxide reductase msrA/msrB
MEAQQEKAYFAGGCFWGTEYYFKNADGVISTRVGYMGGTLENPTYEQVCTKKTGHAEVVEVVFDDSKTTFENMAKLFFEIHDPSQVNRQGPDIGDQYRSEIFYTSGMQKAIAERLIAILKKNGHTVVTRVTAATTFTAAEEYHQRYYEKNGQQPYCHVRVKKFSS